MHKDALQLDLAHRVRMSCGVAPQPDPACGAGLGCGVTLQLHLVHGITLLPVLASGAGLADQLISAD